MNGNPAKGDVTVLQLQRRAGEKLRAAGVESDSRDARILLAHVLGTESGMLPTRYDQLVSGGEAERFMALIGQRCDGRPVHRIIGYREFFGRRFEFDDDCLEPRPETELLVERVLNDLEPSQETVFAEVGTGSGVISVTLLCERVNIQGIATDISAGALATTRKNAEALGVGERILLVHTDCLDGVEGPFDFIVSNPPYIETDEIKALAREVREYDPLAALDGGRDGLDFYRRLLEEAKSGLKTGGRLYLETGHGQHNEICRLAGANGWGVLSCHLDFSGLERIVVLEKSGDPDVNRR